MQQILLGHGKRLEGCREMENLGYHVLELGTWHLRWRREGESGVNQVDKISGRENMGRLRENVSRWLYHLNLSGRYAVVDTTAHATLRGILDLGDGWKKVTFIRYAILASQA
ncbi:uncharacterized protein EAF02_007029 [Botrytis sinoallii]|uniref:uncharacterized protein n=1 Tax=Botrytis sinoallii TaxID=1463999 RepID=UPI0018FFD128|nr:uncharacterized protein EAF02_007029 [Botrytis sinoallii]KAF7881138.1 hypothetical protein EAF02_007029 [Botrytis sinoallii]